MMPELLEPECKKLFHRRVSELTPISNGFIVTNKDEQRYYDEQWDAVLSQVSIVYKQIHAEKLENFTLEIAVYK
jgi:hypothetical protein